MDTTYAFWTVGRCPLDRRSEKRSFEEGVFSKKTEDFPIEKISSVQWSSGIIYGTLTVFASGNKAEIKNVYKEDGKHIVDVLRGRLSSKTEHRPSQEETGVAHQPDAYEQLASTYSEVLTIASCLVDAVRVARNHTISEYVRLQSSASYAMLAY